MEKKIKLVIVLDQESNTSWVPVGGNRGAYFLRRVITWGSLSAVEKNMLLILHIISITQVTGGGITLCEPIDLSHFVVDLRERHLEYWAPYSETHPREHNSKRSTYHRWRALPTKRALVTHLPYILSNYTFLNLPLRDVIRSTARFRLRVHTLRFETATWNQSDPPPLTCVIQRVTELQIPHL
jgi:hypothetical protein